MSSGLKVLHLKWLYNLTRYVVTCTPALSIHRTCSSFSFYFLNCMCRVCIVKFSESQHYDFMHPPSRITCRAPVIVNCTNQEREYFTASGYLQFYYNTHFCFWQSVTWCAEAWTCSSTFDVILSLKSLNIQIAAEWILVDFQVCSGSNLSSSYPVIYTQSKNNLICFKKMDVNSHSQNAFISLHWS